MATASIERMDRISRRGVDKFAERRAELAQAALQTLSELGYAKTSLREIAQNSIFSHGVLHYYFKDKVDLMTCCVRHYKAICVTRYDNVVASARTSEELANGFAAALGETIRTEAQMHRLWYDLRSQALFEQDFRADILEIDKSLENMILRIMTRFSELTGQPLQMSPAVLYAVFDGLFQQCLLKHLAGDAQAIAQMEADVLAVMERFAGQLLQAKAKAAPAKAKAETAAPRRAARVRA